MSDVQELGPPSPKFQHELPPRRTTDRRGTAFRACTLAALCLSNTHRTPPLSRSPTPRHDGGLPSRSGRARYHTARHVRLRAVVLRRVYNAVADRGASCLRRGREQPCIDAHRRRPPPGDGCVQRRKRHWQLLDRPQRQRRRGHVGVDRRHDRRLRELERRRAGKFCIRPSP